MIDAVNEVLAAIRAFGRTCWSVLFDFLAWTTRTAVRLYKDSRRAIIVGLARLARLVQALWQLWLFLIFMTLIGIFSELILDVPYWVIPLVVFLIISIAVFVRLRREGWQRSASAEIIEAWDFIADSKFVKTLFDAVVAISCVLGIPLLHLYLPGVPTPFYAPWVASATPFSESAILQDRLCEKGLPEACARKGDRLLFSEDPSEVAAAVPLLRMSCDADELLGCARLGTALFRGLGVPKDEKGAVSVLEKVCGSEAADYRWTCHGLGSIYEHGTGSVGRDEELAAKFFEKGCDESSPFWCIEFGRMLRDGIGVKQDVKRAAGIFRAACDPESAANCFYYAYVLAKGLGVERDEPEAFRLYKLSCDTFNTSASCNNYAMGVRYGLGGIDQDPVLSLQYFRKACDSDDSKACRSAATLIESGVGDQIDPEKADDLRKKAEEIEAKGPWDNLGP